jgi:hypothetical protein
LDVTAERLPTGELSAQWQSVDPLLDPTTLKIEYRADENSEWRELAASQARISEGKNTLSGDGVWWLQEAPGAVALRLQITDRAGNPTVTQFKLKAPANMAAAGMQPVDSAPQATQPSEGNRADLSNPRYGNSLAENSTSGMNDLVPSAAESPTTGPRAFGVSASAGPTAPSPRYWGAGQNAGQNAAFGAASQPQRPATAQRDTSVGRNPFARYRPTPTEPDNAPQLSGQPPAGGSPNRTSDRDTTGESSRWPASGVASRPLGTGNRTDNDWRVGNSSDRDSSPGFVHTEGNRSTHGSAARHDGFRPAGSGSENDADGLNRDGATMRSASTSGGGPRVSNAASGGAAPRFDYGDLSPAERPKMVNARTFEIDYEIESVGSSGIARVELFGTRDGGESWVSLGTDPDNRSPLVVTVNGEGLYGFAVVVESASGLSGAPPRQGQRPELWIGVDLTKPQVDITGVEPGNNPDELVIYWDAQDRRFNGRPISIFFSNRQGGPWTIAAGSLENTGNYTWRLDNRVREQLYLKVEARDAAGNLGWFETTEPMSLNRQLPQGRIRGVRPIAAESDNGQAHRGKIIENQFVR